MGPEDKPKNIKACLNKCNLVFLKGMQEDWGRVSTDNGKKMQRCIKEVIEENNYVKEG
jgi:hypothetical protein